jgi:hypothetical protein
MLSRLFETGDAAYKERSYPAHNIEYEKYDHKVENDHLTCPLAETRYSAGKTHTIPSFVWPPIISPDHSILSSMACTAFA